MGSVIQHRVDGMEQVLAIMEKRGHEVKRSSAPRGRSGTYLFLPTQHELDERWRDYGGKPDSALRYGDTASPGVVFMEAFPSLRPGLDRSHLRDRMG
jgi:hypothetical protein